MTELFLRYLNAGLVCAVLILLLWLGGARIDRVCTAKWKRLVWLLLALRLLFPVELRLFRPRVVALPVPAVAFSGGAVAYTFGPVAAAAVRRLTGLDILALVWLAGALVCAGRYIVSWCLFRGRLRREAKAVTDEAVLSVLRAEGEAMGLRRLPRVLCWEGCESPLAAGLFRPRIVLPMEACSPEELRFILRHELSHIRRGDLWLKTVLAAAKALHWYNPAVRLMPALADVDMELSCDDEVTKDAPYAVRKAYSEILFRFVGRQDKRRAGRPAQGYTTQFYGGKQIMKKRFSNIFSGGKRRQGVLLLLAAVALVLVLGSAAVYTGQNVSAPAATTAPYVDPATISEAEKLRHVAGAFVAAWRLGDEDSMRAWLADDYTGDLTYEIMKPESADITVFRGLDELKEVLSVEEGTVWPVSVLLLDRKANLKAQLDLAMRKSADGWKVLAYQRDPKEAVAVEIKAAVDLDQIARTERDELEKMLRRFLWAYVEGDEEALRNQLTDDYVGAVTLGYDDMPPYKYTLRGPEALDDISTAVDGAVYPVRAEMMVVYGDGEEDVRFSHLDVETVKTPDGWRVQAYAFGPGK